MASKSQLTVFLIARNWNARPGPTDMAARHILLPNHPCTPNRCRGPIVLLDATIFISLLSLGPQPTPCWSSNLYPQFRLPIFLGSLSQEPRICKFSQSATFVIWVSTTLPSNRDQWRFTQQFSTMQPFSTDLMTLDYTNSGPWLKSIEAYSTDPGLSTGYFHLSSFVQQLTLLHLLRLY